MGSERFWVQKNFKLKIFCVKKFFMFGCWNFLAQKKFYKMLGLKIYGSENFHWYQTKLPRKMLGLWSKNIFDLKNVGFEKFGSQTIWEPKMFWSKKCLHFPDTTSRDPLWLNSKGTLSISNRHQSNTFKTLSLFQVVTNQTPWRHPTDTL